MTESISNMNDYNPLADFSATFNEGHGTGEGKTTVTQKLRIAAAVILVLCFILDMRLSNNGLFILGLGM